MSPEQIQESKDIDHRADLYALGVMCYEMLTGQTPYSGSLSQVLFAHLYQPLPNPRDLVPTLPENVANTIMQAMSKDAHDRFDDVDSMMRSLFAALQSEWG